jgi:endonuclease/exonuclease/phosphatase family metal-dependent hydrolase
VRLRIAFLNILEGGNGKSGDRTLALFGLLRDIDADILGLAEATGFLADGAARLRVFERELGMRSVVCDATSGHHVAMLYRPSLPVIHTFSSSITMYHGLAGITLDLPGAGETNVIVTHLHPFSSILRLAEAQIVLAKAHRTADAIIMGDFNTLPPSEVYPGIDDAPRSMTTRLRGVDGTIDHGAVELFYRNGFHDVGGSAELATYPTSLAGRPDAHTLTMRVDYLFATDVLNACMQFVPPRFSSMEEASDHLPVIVDLCDQ